MRNTRTEQSRHRGLRSRLCLSGKPSASSGVQRRTQFHSPPPFLFLLPACLGRFCLCIAVISHGWLGLSPVTEQVEDSCCEKALHLMFYEWMGGRISGHVPCSRDHHGLLPDPGGEGHARLVSGRESWFFVGETLGSFVACLLRLPSRLHRF